MSLNNMNANLNLRPFKQPAYIVNRFNNFIHESAKTIKRNLVSLDGQIGASKQGQNGDCSLLAAINSLSYSETGRMELEKALGGYIDENGFLTDDINESTGVNTFLSICDRDFSFDEILEAKRSGKYAAGDDDVVVLELATEKLFDDIINGKIGLDEYAPDCAVSIKDKEVSNDKYTSTHATRMDSAYYVLCNRFPVYTFYKEEMNEFLDKFQETNGEDFALIAGTDIDGGFYLENLENNEEYYFGGHHAFAIKNVTDEEVTLTNPWDSGVDVTITRKDFTDNFSELCGCDISDESRASVCFTYKNYYN